MLPTPKKEKHPHTIIQPPPNFTVGITWRSVSSSSGLFQQYSRPSDPNIMNLDSSDQITRFHSSNPQSLYFLANFKRNPRCFFFKYGFFRLILEEKPFLRNVRFTVLELTLILLLVFRFFFFYNKRRLLYILIFINLLRRISILNKSIYY